MDQKIASLSPPKSSPPTRGGLLRRKCACGQHASGGECEECQKKRRTLQRRRGYGAEPAEAPPVVHDVLRSPGRPLDVGVRATMESRLGDLSQVRSRSVAPQLAPSSLEIGSASGPSELEADRIAERAAAVAPPSSGGPRQDFSRVRIHTDARAAESARAVSALAYTVGQDVVFGAGQYRPESAEGRKLLAHELTHVAQQSQAPGAMVRRKGVWGAISGFFSSLAHIFVDYSDGKIQDYISLLDKTGDIEGDPDSDDKARQIVRDKKHLSLSVKIRTLLVQEMLDGWTLGGDESAINEILLNATLMDRKAIVTKIGRANIWKKFSGENRRIVEALTLTADDLKDSGMMTHLRGLSGSELGDYQNNATDPEVAKLISKLIQLKKISTPLGTDTEVDASGSAKLEVNGVEVTFLPDIYTKDTSVEGGGETGIINLEADTPGGQQSDGIIVSVEPTPKVKVTIQTRYKPEIDPSGKSSYGRGTAPGDRGTSLRFHEGSHGLDHIQFLREHPLPTFTGKAGDTLEQFKEAGKKYRNDLEAYFQKLVEFTVRNTDCPGTPISAEGLQTLKLSARFCSQPAH